MERKQSTQRGRAGRRPAQGATKAAQASRSRRAALGALATESERHLADLIARRLALPLEKRMNFLRRRLPGGGSCL